jgi:hypothetical protein
MDDRDVLDLDKIKDGELIEVLIHEIEHARKAAENNQAIFCDRAALCRTELHHQRGNGASREALVLLETMTKRNELQQAHACAQIGFCALLLHIINERCYPDGVAAAE